MTYCIGMRLDAGLVFMSDTRTNAGVDNVSTVRKLFSWSVPGERHITLMTAGNLATTQTVVSLLDERTKPVGDRDPSILSEPSMFRVARLVGETLRKAIDEAVQTGPQSEAASFSATLILGGQIEGSRPTLFLIYPEGNFIEIGDEVPFFQIGETKYGRPILVRAYDPAMDFHEAVKLMLVSFDSTIKANLGVAPPLDALAVPNDAFRPAIERRFQPDDPYLTQISRNWGDALKKALEMLPPFED